jgi:hypothetical protein
LRQVIGSNRGKELLQVTIHIDRFGERDGHRAGLGNLMRPITSSN